MTKTFLSESDLAPFADIDLSIMTDEDIAKVVGDRLGFLVVEEQEIIIQRLIEERDREG